MIKRSILILALAVFASVSASAQSDVVLNSAKFVGDTQFIVIDGNGLRAYPFLVADVLFVGDSLPQDGDELTIAATVFTFRDSPVLATDIQIGGNVDSTVDNARDKINDAHVVLRTSRSGNKIVLVAAEITAPTLTTTASAHAITVTGFASCGAP